MCQRATCKTCGKATYTGCGQHVEQVLANVPKNQRCSCSPDQRSTGGFFSRLLGQTHGH